MKTAQRIMSGGLLLLLVTFLVWWPMPKSSETPAMRGSQFTRRPVAAAGESRTSPERTETTPSPSPSPKEGVGARSQLPQVEAPVHTIESQIREARGWFAQTLRADGDTAFVAMVDGPSGFSFQADARGVEVRPHLTASWTWKMKPADTRPVAPRAEKKRLSYERPDGVTEWFVNGNDGIEHGFTLPHDDGDTVRKIATLVETELGAVPRAGREGVDFLDENGATQLHYDGLMAFDATGKMLESWMELQTPSAPSSPVSASGTPVRSLTLAVNTAGATFPVTIDPVISLAGAVIQPSPAETGDAFATDMDTEGNLLVVGAPGRNAPGTTEAGAVFVFARDTGCSFGWSQVTQLTAPIELLRAFGKSLALGGGTLAVTTERDDSAVGVVDEVRLYSLDEAGSATPLKTLLIGQNLAGFQISLDVSADGNTVAVGSTGLRYDSNPGQPQTGRIFVFDRHEGGANNWGIAATLQPPSPAAGAEFGSSLSLSENRLAVGAPGIADGRVFVYAREGGTWPLDETFSPPAVTPPATTQGFGRSVVLHGNRLAIGAPDSDTGGPFSGINTGRVLVAERRATGEWITGSLPLTPSNFGGDRFGTVLHLSDTQLSIAGPGASSLWRRVPSTSSDAASGWSMEREDTATSLGLAGAISSLHHSGDLMLTGSAAAGRIVARRQTATNWPVTAHFNEGPAGHLTGSALARDGDLLAIGAPGATASHNRSVYVLRRIPGAGPGQEWSLAHTFTDNSGGFGSSLALKDGILLIGAPGVGNGVVLSYRRQNAAATSWSTPQLLFPPVTFPAAAFGSAVAFNGVYAVVGDPEANNGRGGMVVFQRPASGEWPVVMGGPAAAPFQGYGASVAITEGHHMLVGAPLTPVPADVVIPDGGAVFVWRYAPVSQHPAASTWTPAWTLEQHLFPDGSASDRSNGRFGASVAMHGQHALIGAPGNGTPSQRGRVLVFRRDEPPLPPADPVPTQIPWRQVATIFPGNLTDSPPEAPFFGHSIALNATHAAIGAPGDLTHAGQVFLYSSAPSGLLWSPIARMQDPCGAPGDQFGSAVAAPTIDELAVGAPGAGVTLFEKGRSEWRLVRNVPTQSQVFSNILPLGFGEGPLAVGSSLAIEGDWLVVGAPRHTHLTSTGPAPVVSVTDPWKQVFVLHRRSRAGLGSEAWETTTVLAFGGTTWSYATSFNDNLTGLSVDISGRHVIVGEGSSQNNGGIAYIARLEADGTQPLLELTPDGYLLNNGFEILQSPGGSNLTGHSVAISGSYAAVGNGDGAAHIYEWRGWHDPHAVGGGLAGTRQWKLVKSLERQPFEARGFGSAVALDGLRLAVGADQHRNDDGGSDGMVLLFERDLGGPDNWGLRQELQLPEPLAEEGVYLGMGGALALEGDTLVAGARGDVGEGYVGLPNGHVRTFGTGAAAFVFERHAGGADNWGFTASLFGSDSIGVSVAISGNTIALGTPGAVFDEYDEHEQLPGFYNLIGPYFQRGKVTLFHRLQANSRGAAETTAPAWGEIATFEQANPSEAHTLSFGAAVALSGGTLAIGSPGHDGDFNFNGGPYPSGRVTPGRAFVYDLRRTGTQQWRDIWLPDIIATTGGGATPYSGTANPGDLDFDNDGLPNMMEQFHGLNPFVADSHQGGLLSSSLDPATGDLVLTWREALDHELTVTPQWSRTVTQWHDSGSGPSAGDVKTFAVTIVSTHETFVIKEARVPAASEPLFFARILATE